MGKTFSHLIIIIALLLMSIGTATVVRHVNQNNSRAPRQSGPNSWIFVLLVLKAHSNGSDRDWTRFSQTGTLRYYPHLATGSQRFERKIRLATDGPVVRYDRTTFDITQSYLFDGNILVSKASEDGSRRPLDSVETESLRFQIRTSGLLPVLKRLSDPATKVVYLGATAKGDRFEVKTQNGSWYFYSNSNHLIDQLEVGEINIMFEDYRTVNGLTLPYYQSVRKGNALLYDIKFDTFELNPVFASDFFES
jgi:hypothetical protein